MNIKYYHSPVSLTGIILNTPVAAGVAAAAGAAAGAASAATATAVPTGTIGVAVAVVRGSCSASGTAADRDARVRLGLTTGGIDASDGVLASRVRS